MFKGVSISGPSVTGVSLSIQNLHLSGRTFALLILGTEVVRFVSPYGWVDWSAKALAVSLCLVRILAPEKRTPGGAK